MVCRESHIRDAIEKRDLATESTRNARIVQEQRAASVGEGHQVGVTNLDIKTDILASDLRFLSGSIEDEAVDPNHVKELGHRECAVEARRDIALRVHVKIGIASKCDHVDNTRGKTFNRETGGASCNRFDKLEGHIAGTNRSASINCRDRVGVGNLHTRCGDGSEWSERKVEGPARSRETKFSLAEDQTEVRTINACIN